MLETTLDVIYYIRGLQEIAQNTIYFTEEMLETI